MKTRFALVYRILNIIVVTGLFPILVMTLVYGLLMRPLLSGIDAQSAVAEMNRILSEIDRVIETEKTSIRIIANHLTADAGDIRESDFPGIMDQYAVDVLALSTGGDFSDMTLWIRTGNDAADTGNTRLFSGSVLKGPYAAGRLSPWGFISPDDETGMYIISSFSSGITGMTVATIIGHSMSSVVERYQSRNPEHRIRFSAALPSETGIPVSSFIKNDAIMFNPVTPEALDFQIIGKTAISSVLVDAPFLEHGLKITVERPSMSSAAGFDRLIRILSVVALILIIQIILVALWFRYRVSSPLISLIRGIEAWDGMRLTDFGNLTDRKDEIGKLAHTFQQMSVEIRSKTRSLEEQAVKDSLTGLFNRRRFDETLQNEWERQQRDHGHLALILGDIDHFKLFNDNYGHPAGDDCLRQVAGACIRVLQRPGDLPFRYGGEEFALILADTDLDGAAAVAESVRKGVESLNIENAGSPSGGRITISLGVAAAGPENPITRDELLRSADRALYKAKENGRNRVIR